MLTGCQPLLMPSPTVCGILSYCLKGSFQAMSWYLRMNCLHQPCVIAKAAGEGSRKGGWYGGFSWTNYIEPTTELNEQTILLYTIYLRVYMRFMH